MRLLLLGLALVGMTQRPWTPVATIDGDPVMRGLARDAIPAIDRPVFVSAAQAAAYMRDDEPVIGITDGTTTKAYSAWHLNAHEIVNDTLGSSPIAVTWCPLCYTGIVYSREAESRELTFGVSGMLWRENLVMYDRQTDSWWAQATGKAIQGPLKGAALRQLPATMMTWREWRRLHPTTLVLSKSTTGGIRGRTDNYAGYHQSEALGVTGRLRATRGSLAPKARIVGFQTGGGQWVVDLDAMAGSRVKVTRSTGEALVIATTADRSGARVFRAGGHAFTVATRDDDAVVVDEATRSVWRALTGTAIEGPLAGRQLEEVPSSMAYWFAWRAFYPGSKVID